MEYVFTNRTPRRVGRAGGLGVVLMLAALSVPAARAAGPVARVFETVDEWTHAQGAAGALEAAGFEVRLLTADAPLDDAALVLFGSFASEAPEYAAIAEKRRAELLAFVERGGVLLQMTQADQTEASPPFLPDGLSARRDDTDHSRLIALAAEHPLLAGLTRPAEDETLEIVLPKHLSRPANWESLAAQRGFRVLVASDAAGRHPALLEAAVGKGRLLLTSLFLDKRLYADGKPIGEAALRDASDRFFRNLHDYVVAVQAGRAPAVTPTPPYEPPPPLPFVEGSFTLAVLPDTQIYAESYLGLFENQTRWIADHREERKIAFVVHLGDVTNRNLPEQWENARRAFSFLDGYVPYAIAPGNHDYGPGGGTQDRTTYLNEYFAPAEFEQRPTFGGLFEPGRLDNSYHLFRAGDTDWIVLALEFGPRDEVVAWANEVLARHADRRAIIVTHAYMYMDDTRYDRQKYPDQMWSPYAYPSAKLPGGTNDGEDLWRKLISRHANVVFVLSGHVLGDGTGRMASVTPQGNVVHQLLSNYQFRAIGGEGYLRLMEFLPDGETVQVKTYSPFLNKYLREEDQQFVLKLEPARSVKLPKPSVDGR